MAKKKIGRKSEREYIRVGADLSATSFESDGEYRGGTLEV